MKLFFVLLRCCINIWTQYKYLNKWLNNKVINIVFGLFTLKTVQIQSTNSKKIIITEVYLTLKRQHHHVMISETRCNFTVNYWTNKNLTAVKNISVLLILK